MSRRLYFGMALFWCGIFVAPVVMHAQEAQSRATDDKSSRDLLRRQMELKLRELEAASGSPEDETDLGAQILLKRKPKPWALTLSSDVGEVWSNNVFLSEGFKQGDLALTQNDSAFFSYKLTDELTASLSYRFSMYRYHRLQIQNFDSHNAGFGLNYTLPLDISLYAGTQWTTIYSRPIGDSVYEEGDIYLGASKVFPINFINVLKDRAAWFVGYQTDLRMASPKEFDRVEISPYTGFMYQVNPQTVWQTYYRWQYLKYQINGRRDYNNSISSSVAYSPWDWLTLSAFVGFTDNNSLGINNRNYDVFNTGGSVKLSWKF